MLSLSAQAITSWQNFSVCPRLIARMLWQLLHVENPHMLECEAISSSPTFFSLFMILITCRLGHTFYHQLVQAISPEQNQSLTLFVINRWVFWQLFQIEKPHVPNLSNMGRPIARSHIRQFILGRGRLVRGGGG